jgi:GntR family transcriptional repressor for pyruvate dehydrogenase complex
MIIDQTGGSIWIISARCVRSSKSRRWVVPEATDKDFERLDSVLRDLSLAKEDPAEFNRLDAEFHSVLAEASHNPFLAVLLDSIRELMRNVRQMIQHYPRLVDVVIPDHLAIYEAIKSRNPEGGARHAKTSRACPPNPGRISRLA